jgi:hypothetical protein
VTGSEVLLEIKFQMVVAEEVREEVYQIVEHPEVELVVDGVTTMV